MPRISINKADHERSILTDALPYETPIIFSNEGLYRFLKVFGYPDFSEEVDSESDVVGNLLCPKKGHTVPFNYQIRNNIDDRRTLSVIHPKSQSQLANFYRKFDQQIVHQCSLSPCSLRSPAFVATHFYESGLASSQSEIAIDEVELETDGFGAQPQFGSSYFAYKSFNLLSRFLDSYAFLNLEKKFHHLLTLDVSKCFASIYTHSIGWAVKDKEYSKEHRDTFSFESEFDKLMQGCNYNETNGIVIGPEVSRVFAEVILQKIERNAITRIRDKYDLKHDIDFSVRRYVDDYFIFSRESRVGDKILEVVQEELEVFKLYLNKSKTTRFTVPFQTPLTQARLEINEYLSAEFAKIIDKEAEIISIVPSGRSKKWMVSLKGIVASRTSNYVGISNLVLFRLRRFIEKAVNTWEKGKLGGERTITSCLIAALDLVFFVYSMDTRVRSTYLVAQTTVLVNRVASSLSPGNREILEKRILDGCIHVLDTPLSAECAFAAEKQNLLIALSDLGENYILSEARLARVAGFKNVAGEYQVRTDCDYFQLVSLLFYMKAHEQYSGLRDAVEALIVNKIEARSNLTIYTEHTMLLLDSLACPYIKSSTKKKLSEIAVIQTGGGASNKDGINGKVEKFCSSREWFVCWKSFINIQHLLNKKELKTPYS